MCICHIASRTYGIDKILVIRHVAALVRNNFLVANVVVLNRDDQSSSQSIWTVGIIGHLDSRTVLLDPAGAISLQLLREFDRDSIITGITFLLRQVAKR